MAPFQTKDDHLAAWVNVYQRFAKATEDYIAGETGYARYSRERYEMMEDMKNLCDLTLSDPNYVEPKPF